MAENKNNNEIKRILEDINNNLIDLTSVIDLYSINPQGTMRGTPKQINIFLGLKTKRFPQDKAKIDRDNIKMFKKEINDILYYIDFGNLRLSESKIELAQKTLSKISFFDINQFNTLLEKIKSLLI